MPYLKNKYVIVLLSFAAWMIFFDRYDLMFQYKLRKELRDAKKEKAFYIEKISEVKQTREKLFTDKASLEKFAREEYLMKKKNEEIFLIVTED